MKREDIKGELIERDWEIYTIFEEKVKPFTTSKEMILSHFDTLSYLFCKECSYRDIENHLDYEEESQNYISFNFDDPLEILHDGNFYLGQHILSESSESTNNFLKSLYAANNELFQYFWNVTNFVFREGEETIYKTKDVEQYKVVNIVKKENLLYAIGQQSLDRLFHDTELIPNSIDLFEIYEQLTDEEKTQIIGLWNNQNRQLFQTELKTYIFNTGKSIEKNIANNKTIFIEMDLSKSKKQLLQYLEHIIEEYQKTDSPIKTLYELLNLNKEYYEDMTNIMKENRDIPLYLKLADLIYIYDCTKAGHSIRDILCSLNSYYENDLNLKSEVFSRGTIANWQKLIKIYIDDLKYKSYFLSQLDTESLDSFSEPIGDILAYAEEEYWSNKYN